MLIHTTKCKHTTHTHTHSQSYLIRLREKLFNSQRHKMYNEMLSPTVKSFSSYYLHCHFHLWRGFYFLLFFLALFLLFHAINSILEVFSSCLVYLYILYFLCGFFLLFICVLLSLTLFFCDTFADLFVSTWCNFVNFFNGNLVLWTSITRNKKKTRN